MNELAPPREGPHGIRGTGKPHGAHGRGAWLLGQNRFRSQTTLPAEHEPCRANNDRKTGFGGNAGILNGKRNDLVEPQG